MEPLSRRTSRATQRRSSAVVIAVATGTARVQSVVMRDTVAHILLAALFVAATLCGCARQSSVMAASRLAVTRSNQEAERLYQIKPFKQEHGQWRHEGQRRIWEALTSFRGHDMIARVTFDEHGAVVDLDVQMLTHPTAEPVINLDDLFDPEIQREKKSGIPEVVPK